MKLKEEFKEELFKSKEEFVVNKKTISSFFKRLTVISEKLQKQKDEDSERLERSVKGTELKAELKRANSKNSTQYNFSYYPENETIGISQCYYQGRYDENYGDYIYEWYCNGTYVGERYIWSDCEMLE